MSVAANMIIKALKKMEGKKGEREEEQTPKPHTAPKTPKTKMITKSPCRKIIIFEVDQLSLLQTQM